MVFVSCLFVTLADELISIPKKVCTRSSHTNFLRIFPNPGDGNGVVFGVIWGPLLFQQPVADVGNDCMQ